MKMAVTTSNNKGMNAKVSSKFGRASYFAIMEVDKDGVNFIANAAVDAASGAGVRAAQTLADQEVEVLISGNVGPKAFNGLQAAGIEIYSTNKSNLQEAIAAYQAEELEKLDAPTNSSHVGLK